MARVAESGGARAMEAWLLPFAGMFTRPSWLNAAALATGALLCLNRRTVCAALRAVDGAADKGFGRFHRFLSRATWSGLEGARILLGLLYEAFVPEGEPIVGVVDDTVERRRGARIRDKGIYRDAVRSSRGFFVKVEGLRWLSGPWGRRSGHARHPRAHRSHHPRPRRRGPAWRASRSPGSPGATSAAPPPGPARRLAGSASAR